MKITNNIRSDSTGYRQDPRKRPKEALYQLFLEIVEIHHLKCNNPITLAFS